MKKQIYFKKQPVKMGERVTVNGVTIEVNDQNIENNPDLFEVEELPRFLDISARMHNFVMGSAHKDKFKTGDWVKDCLSGEVGVVKASRGYITPVDYFGDCVHYYSDHGNISIELLRPATKEEIKEAVERHYPKGTNIACAFNDSRDIVREFYEVDQYGTWVRCENSNALIHYEGEWAKIVESPLFTTEDGVNIYDGDSYYFVKPKTDEIYKVDSITRFDWSMTPSSNSIRFSTREAAEDYIARHKEKTLEDYVTEVIDEDPAIMRTLRHCYPKLFYIHVMQKIANNLNPKSEDNFGNTWFVEYYPLRESDEQQYEPDGNMTFHQGVVKFSSEEAAEKAIEIMGDKLDIIFK